MPTRLPSPVATARSAIMALSQDAALQPLRGLS
jgi:hypothetical protein